jgi:5-methylcytosine-specific restriction endonuclease McrA
VHRRVSDRVGPVMAGSFCTVCRRRIPRGSRCSKHRTVSPSSKAWHEPGAARTRQKVLARDGACFFCGTDERLQVHHIIPAAEGGATEPGNLTVLCEDCHREAEGGVEPMGSKAAQAISLRPWRASAR